MPKDFILYALFGGHFLSYSMPDALKIYRIGYNNDKNLKIIPVLVYYLDLVRTQVLIR